MSDFSLFGVNLSGAEYNAGVPGKINFDYTYPTHAEIDYFASNAFTAIRLPFVWERVQPVMNGALSASELSYIDDVVSYANSKGIKLILDPHNYGYGYDAQIGSAALPNAAFANFWGQLAGHFSSNANVLFGLMNEPHDISATQWIGSVNAAIEAIRASGATSQQILVPGTYWDGAASWVSSDNAEVVGAGVIDPAHNFAFEVHQYLDSDGSGTHPDVVSTTIGVEKLTDITAWAEATGNKLFLGEFGISSDAVSLAALNNMLGFMQQHSGVWEGGTYWAAGAWLGPYMYSVEPAQGINKPQMAILSQYAKTSTGILSGTSSTLESLETSFHQDFNGDGVIGLAVDTGATLELVGADSGSVTFIGSTGTLRLDTPSTFNGQIFGFTGDGTLAGSDQIDLSNLNYNNAIQCPYNSSTGLLEVSNGTSTVDLHFLVSYSQDNFKFASDGHGGTVVYDPPTAPSGAKDAAIHITGSSTINDTSSQLIVESSAMPTLADVAIKGSTITNNGTVGVAGNSTVNILAGAGQDTFLFKPNFGQATRTHFTPGTDTIQIKPAVFTSIESLLAAIHDDSHGHSVITDPTHDIITVQDVPAAQLLAHQVDFYFV
jgi:aryl-phospho-beta-D-glucosidase BglC (GH1 family)